MSRTIQGTSTVGIKLTLVSDNPVTILPTGTINSPGLYAIYGSDSVAWSLINRGKLSGGHSGVTFAGTGTITNGSATATHASISGSDDGIIVTGGAATVVNDGTITGTSATSVGVYLAHGGLVTNGASGITAAFISGGRYGVKIAGGPGTIVNRGLIRGNEDTVLIKGGKGTVVNYGRIGASTSVGIALYDGGSVTNSSAGTIISHGLAINVSGSSSSTITNHGLISGARGIFMSGNSGTAINAGTITSSQLEAFSGERMIVDPGAVFGGKVRTNVLELAKGATPGTLSLLGARYLDRTLGGTHTVGTIIVDAGAQWTLAGSNTLTSGATLTANGTLTNAGVLGGQGVLLDNGTVVNTGIIGPQIQVTLNAGSYLLNQQNATIRLTSGATLTASGTLTNAGVLGGQGVLLDNGTVVNTGIIGPQIQVTLNAGSYLLNQQNATIQLTSGATLTASGTLTNAGALRGQGVLLDNGKVVNAGTIDPLIQLTVNAGSYLLNQETGTILGSVDEAADTSKLTNLGLIHDTRATGAAVRLDAGGTVTNGSAADTAASIIGYSPINVSSGLATITNFGTIANLEPLLHSQGVDLHLASGGNITNGSEVDRTAIISGGNTGILSNGSIASVANFGTVTAGYYGIEFGLACIGSVVNGSETDVGALIQASISVDAYGFPAGGVAVDADQAVTVTNFGVIKSAKDAFDLGDGGTIVNGSERDTVASIIGGRMSIFFIGGGVDGTINNFGTITGEIDQILPMDRAVLTNGSESDTKAFMSGGCIFFSAAAITNFGTMDFVNTGGTVVNGSATDTTAVIETTALNRHGVDAGAISNFGTIKSDYVGGAGGTIINGSPLDRGALIVGGSVGLQSFALMTNYGTIEGSTGIVCVPSGGTVINAGTIMSTDGMAGTAIDFFSGSGHLVIDPGAVFIGAVTSSAGSNALELASGGSTVGSIGGIGSQFTNFDTMTVDPGANWMLSGSNNIAMVTNDGSLSIAAGGTLEITASVDPLSNGLFQINANSLLEIEANTGAADQMKFLGAGRLTVDTAAQFGAQVGTTAYAGPLIESFVNGDKIDLKDVLLTGSVLNYTSTTGLLQVTQGGASVATLAFETSSLGAGSFHAADDGSGHLLLTHS